MSKKTIVVFSGEYDKLMAAFIIATGAAAMDDEVTMFFTFWAVNALKKPKGTPSNGPANPNLSALQKGFSMVMPKGAERLGLSKFNFAGIGQKMMRKVMRDQNVMSLSELVDLARELDIEMIVCTMSMDVMGIDKNELIDGLEYGGVATYLGEAEEANLNLFI